MTKEQTPLEHQEWLEICYNWRNFWMDQTQNNEADRKNYFNRAIGVDANMLHHLAGVIHDRHQAKIARLSAQLKKAVETLEIVWANPHESSRKALCIEALKKIDAIGAEGE